MKIVGLTVNGSSSSKPSDLSSLHRNHAFEMLKLTPNFWRRFMDDRESKLLEKFAADDGVGNTGLVLQANEDLAFRGGMPLTAMTTPGYGDRLTVIAQGEIGSAGDKG